MKAISIRQPWAWLILHAGKDIENRDWSTRYRGPVLIHASQGMTHSEYEEGLNLAQAIRKTLVVPGSPGHLLRMPAFTDLRRGGIVGQVDIVDCVQEHPSPWFFGDFGFVLANPRAIPFHRCKGMLGFFQPPVLPEEVSARG